MTRIEATITGVAGLSALAMATPAARAEDSKEANPEVEKIRALLKAHDKAMTNHDLKGVMACLTEKAAIMGTGPGEIWVGPEDIKVAYEHFFEGFDKGEQNFECQFKIGGVTADMGWLMAFGNVRGKKGGKGFRLPSEHLADRREKRRRLADRGDAFFDANGRRRSVSPRNQMITQRLFLL